MIFQDTKVIAFNNQKGGVGKTTMSLNVAFELTKRGYKVLVLDLDPQGNIGTSLGFNTYDDELNYIEELLCDRVDPDVSIRDTQKYTWEEIKEYIYTPKYTERRRIEGTTKWENVEVPFGFDITLATTDLSYIELEMCLKRINQKLYLFFVSDFVDVIKDQKIYDFIIIDTPPSIGLLATNAMSAATDGIVIVSTLELNSFKGIARLIKSLEDVKNVTNKLKNESDGQKNEEHKGVLGIALNAFKGGRKIDKELKEYVETYYPTPTFQSQIGEYSAKAKTASATGYILSQLNDKAANDYKNLVDEIELAIKNPDMMKEKSELLFKTIVGGEK